MTTPSGADSLRFSSRPRSEGTVFKEDGQAKPGLQIFKDHGYNWIRLRLFHTPTRLPNNLEYTIALAQDAKKLGFKFLLNYHYSDTWADPGKQFIPKAWEGKSHAELVQAVFEYTRDTIVAFRDAGVMPDMVQIGNEITQRHALARRQAARQLGQLRGPAARPGSRASTTGRGDGAAPADHDPHRQRRQPEARRSGSSTS